MPISRRQQRKPMRARAQARKVRIARVLGSTIELVPPVMVIAGIVMVLAAATLAGVQQSSANPAHLMALILGGGFLAFLGLISLSNK